MFKFFELFITFFTVLIFWAVLSLLLAWVGMICWNFCMPVMFGVPEVSYWTMYVFLILIRLILPSSSSTSK